MRCLVCGKLITREESVNRLIGPECFERLKARRDLDAGKVAVCLEEAARRLDAFVQRTAMYLDPSQTEATKRKADRILGDILKYPAQVLSRQLWADANQVTRQVSDKIEQAISSLASYAGELATGSADWKKHEECWAELCGALDAACGYRLVASRQPRRLARLFRGRPDRPARRTPGGLRIQAVLDLSGAPNLLIQPETEKEDLDICLNPSPSTSEAGPPSSGERKPEPVWLF